MLKYSKPLWLCLHVCVCITLIFIWIFRFIQPYFRAYFTVESSHFLFFSKDSFKKIWEGQRRRSAQSDGPVN